MSEETIYEGAKPRKADGLFVEPTIYGATVKQIEVTPEPPIPQHLADLNARLHALGRTDAVVSATSTQAQIERAERIALHAEASASLHGDGIIETTPVDGAQRQRNIIGKIFSLAGQRKAPGFLQKLLDDAERKRSEADSAKGAADHAIQKAIERQNQYDALRADLSRAKDELDRARTLRATFEERLAELEQPEELTRRWVLACGALGSPFQNTSPEARAGELDWGRLAMTAALADWPGVEKILLARIAKLEAAIKKIENTDL